MRFESASSSETSSPEVISPPYILSSRYETRLALKSKSASSSESFCSELLSPQFWFCWTPRMGEGFESALLISLFCLEVCMVMGMVVLQITH